MESTALFTANNVWMMICTALVFFMHLGFSFLEIGLTRQKNTVNILFKNFFVITAGLLLYAIGGFNLMYPGFEEGASGFLKFAGFGIEPPDGGMTSAYADSGYTWWTDFLFQGMFAATAATIVSGAVAERIKLNSFMLFTILYVGLVYPIIGSWKWGGGFLDQWGFYDFAGSTLVHSVGGWAALIAVYLLGARIGKFSPDGKPKAIPGHMATHADKSLIDRQATVNVVDYQYVSDSGLKIENINMFSNITDEDNGFGSRTMVMYRPNKEWRYGSEIYYFSEDLNINDMGYLLS